MKTHVQRRSLLVTPDSPQDVAFIEDTLGLKVMGDYVVLRRVVVPIAGGTGSILGMETVRVHESSDAEPADGPTTVDELLEIKDDDDDDNNGAPPVVDV